MKNLSITVYARVMDLPEVDCFFVQPVDEYYEGRNKSSEMGSIRSKAADVTPFYWSLNSERLEFQPGFIGPISSASRMYFLYNVSSFSPVRTVDLKSLAKAHALTFPLIGLILSGIYCILRKVFTNSHFLWRIQLFQAFYWLLTLRYVSKAITCLLVLDNNMKDPLKDEMGYLRLRKTEKFRLLSNAPSFRLHKCRQAIAATGSPVCKAIIELKFRLLSNAPSFRLHKCRQAIAATGSPVCKAIIEDLERKPLRLADFGSALQAGHVLLSYNAYTFPSKSCQLRTVRATDLIEGMTGAYSSLSRPPPFTPELVDLVRRISKWELGAQEKLSQAYRRNCEWFSISPPKRPLTLAQLQEIFLLCLTLHLTALGILPLQFALTQHIYFVKTLCMFAFN